MLHEHTAAKTVVLDELLAAIDAWDIRIPTLFSEELLQLAGVDEADDARHDRASVRYLLEVSGCRRAQTRLVERAAAAIAMKYPWLAAECRVVTKRLLKTGAA